MRSGDRQGGARPPDSTREMAVRPFTVVIAVACDPSIPDGLKAALGPKVTVLPTSDPSVLSRDLRVLVGQARLLVVGPEGHGTLCRLARTDPALLDGAVVATLGASRELEAELRSASPGARIVRVAADASVADLAALARLGTG